MQTKFNNYTNELNEIVGILNTFPQIQHISSKELQKYKDLIARKEFLQKKINTLLNKRAKIIGKYNDKNRIWLESNMNCRKYYKLEQSAAYSRDSSLYRIGFLDYKPTLPIILNLKTLFQEKLFEPFSFKFSKLKQNLNSYFQTTSQKSPICKSIKKSKNYIQNDLPTSLAKTAILGMKKCIISYRKLSNSFSRNISNTTPIKTLSFLVHQAQEEANLEQNSFISRIKVNPNTNEYAFSSAKINGYYGNERPVLSVNSNSKISTKRINQPNFDLAL